MGPSTSNHRNATPGCPSFSASGFCQREAPGLERNSREASGRMISPASNQTSSWLVDGSGVISNLPSHRKSLGGVSEYTVIGSDRCPRETSSRFGMNHLFEGPGPTQTEYALSAIR